MHVVDLPGHGYSRDCGLPLEPHACAAAIAAVTPPAIWLGWSLGGLIALTAALDMPRQVQRPGDAVRHTEVRARRQLAAWQRRAPWCTSWRPIWKPTTTATLERFLALEAMGSDDPRAELRHLRQLVFARGEPDLRVLQEGIRILQNTDRRGALPDLSHAQRMDRRTPRPAGAAAGDGLVGRAMRRQLQRDPACRPRAVLRPCRGGGAGDAGVAGHLLHRPPFRVRRDERFPPRPPAGPPPLRPRRDAATNSTTCCSAKCRPRCSSDWISTSSRHRSAWSMSAPAPVAAARC